MVNVQQTSNVVAAVLVVYTMKNSQECTSMVLVYMYVHICECASKKTKCLVCIEILPLRHQLEKHQNDIQLVGINKFILAFINVYVALGYSVSICVISIYTVRFGVGGRGLEKEYSFYACMKAENCG